MMTGIKSSNALKSLIVEQSTLHVYEFVYLTNVPGSLQKLPQILKQKS